MNVRRPFSPRGARRNSMSSRAAALRRLRQGVGDEVEAAVVELRVGVHAGDVSRVDLEAVARAPELGQALDPALLTLLSEHVARAVDAGPELRADQGSVVEV